jgi:hypothetical protein
MQVTADIPRESKKWHLRRDFLKYTSASALLIASSDLVGDLIAQSSAKDPLQSPFSASPRSPQRRETGRLLLRRHPLHAQRQQRRQRERRHRPQRR